MAVDGVSMVAPRSVNTGFGRSGKNSDKKIQPEDVARVVALFGGGFLLAATSAGFKPPEICR